MKTEAKIEVSTIGIEKANTIAIYETNGTTFNGHYQEQERMNILQLYVNDSGAGTPFVEGPNVIVIPTSLFTETVFNAYVQNETLSETSIYSADDEIFMFISVGRDGSIEQACEEIDFVFIRFDISSEDAMAVLTLLLTCLVNETTNETTIVYSYVSTKLNDTTAVMMNLPISVIGFIPWFCNFTESPLGSKPETKDDVFWKPLKTLGKAIVGVIMFIGMAIVAFVELIIDFVAEILMEWLPILEYILWLIIRVIILIFAFILLAISLIMTICSNLILGTMAMIFMPILAAKTKFGLFFVEIEFAQSKIRIDTKINWKYIEFFSLTLPYLTETILLNDTLIRETKSGILGTFSEEQEITSDTQLDLFDGVYSPDTSSIETVDTSFSSEDEHAPDLNFIGQSPSNGFSEDKFTFKVEYSDIDGDAPSEDYGVKLVLISPLGDTKEYTMITKETSPNYETGVAFECVIGDDNDEKLTLAGIWHYYFVAEDTTSLKTALIENDETAFDGPTITFDLNSFSTMFFWYTLFCGIIPMALFSAAGFYATKKQQHAALMLGLSGIGIGVGSSLFMIKNILGDFPTLDVWGKIKYLPIPKGNKEEIDPYSGFWGAMLACSFISIALTIVLSHKFDVTGLDDLKIIFTSIGALAQDFIFLAINCYSSIFNQLWKWIFTGIKIVSSFTGLLFSSILLCQGIYGKNWIKKNKDGTMNKALKTVVSEEVKRIPKIYCGWMTFMTIVFIICTAIMYGYRFNTQIE